MKASAVIIMAAMLAGCMTAPGIQEFQEQDVFLLSVARHCESEQDRTEVGAKMSEFMQAWEALTAWVDSVRVGSVILAAMKGCQWGHRVEPVRDGRQSSKGDAVVTFSTNYFAGFLGDSLPIDYDQAAIREDAWRTCKGWGYAWMDETATESTRCRGEYCEVSISYFCTSEPPDMADQLPITDGELK